MSFLIFCGSGIGDFILILPMVKNIKAGNRSAQIDIIICSDRNRVKINKDLLKIQSYIDRVLYYSMNELGHDLKLIMNLGYHKYDYGFVLQYTDNIYTSVWPYRIVNFASKKICGIKLNYKKIKYDYYVQRVEGTHIGEYPLLMLKEINLYNDCNDTNAILNKDEIKVYYNITTANEGMKKIIVCLGTANVSGIMDGKRISKPLKKWSMDYWISLISRLLDDGFQIILIGGNQEKKELQTRDMNLTRYNVIDLVGKTRVLESMAVIAQADMVVGADTGMMHCAGAMGIPNLTLFGCTCHSEYLPFGEKSEYIQSTVQCSPCFGKDIAIHCKDNYCMKEISVDMVYERVKEILKG